MAAEGQQPLTPGLTAPPVGAGRGRPSEPPELGARSLSVAARLMAGASVFFFISFLFAYFYLRSLNEEHMWRPKHIDPSQGLGAAFVACIIVSALLTVLGGVRMRARARDWMLPIFGAVVLGLAAVALQCIEYTRQHWGPTNGAYASVFCIWMAFYMIAVLATMYWLETQAASELRARRAPAGRGDITNPDLLIAPGLDAAVFYWCFLAAIGVITWVVLYLI